MTAAPTGDEEDRRLLDEWLQGPGARPTADDRARWLNAAQSMTATEQKPDA